MNCDVCFRFETYRTHMPMGISMALLSRVSLWLSLAVDIRTLYNLVFENLQV